MLSEQRRVRIAYVSVYGTACGIATYNEQLLAELRQFADVRVFAEYDDETHAGHLFGDPDWVVRCWDRHEHPKLELLAQIDSWKPELVHFGHEYGFFARAYQFTGLVSTLKIRGYNVLATLHSVYDHADKVVQEACLPHILVHTLMAAVTLAKKGIDPDRINIIPHGSQFFLGTSDHPELLGDLWSTWGSNHTIFHPGFMFKYKGHMRMLRAVARLKEQFSDIQYVIQGSENPHTMTEHNELYADLVNEMVRLDIESNVTINRGFIEQEVLLSHIRTVKCCALPYAGHPDHNVRATSGIARLVLATQTPLVVSQAHLFDDLEGVVLRPGDDEELYQALYKVFTDPQEKIRQIAARKILLEKTNWPAVAYKTAILYDRLTGS